VETLLGDVTRANAGTEADLVSRLVAHRPIGPERLLTVVCRTSQINSVSAAVPTASVFEVDESSDYRTVASVVSNLTRQALQAGATKISVFSFHGVVFDLASRFPPPTTEFLGWKTVPYAHNSQVTSSRWEWPQDLPESEAVEFLKRALKGAGAHGSDTGIRQTNLRYVLEREDDRLKKTHPVGRTQGLISHIVKAAEQRGLLEIKDRETINPLVWLREPAQAHSEQVPKPAAATSVAAKLPPKRQSRSQQFINALREANYGPYSDYRLALYSHVRDAVAQANPHGARQLQAILRDAVERMKAQIAGRYGKQKADDFSWRKLHEFLGKLVTRNPVMLDDMLEPTYPSFATLSTQIRELAPRFEIELDGVLVVELVSRVRDISVHDLPQLAGALYMDRTDADVDRISEVVGLLRERGNIVEGEGDSRFLSLGPNQQLGRRGETPMLT